MEWCEVQLQEKPVVNMRRYRKVSSAFLAACMILTVHVAVCTPDQPGYMKSRTESETGQDLLKEKPGAGESAISLQKASSDTPATCPADESPATAVPASQMEAPELFPVSFADDTEYPAETVWKTEGGTGQPSGEILSPSVPLLGQGTLEIPDNAGSVADIAGPVTDITGSVTDAAGPVTDIAGPVMDIAGEEKVPAPDRAEIGIIADQGDNPGMSEETDGSTAADMSEVNGFFVDASGMICGISDPDIAFSGEYLELPADQCVGIAAGAFLGAPEGICEMFLPSNIVCIEEGAFLGLDQLEWIEMEQSGEFFTEDGVLFSEGGICLFAFPAGRIGQYKVPGTVTRFAADAFTQASLDTVDAVENSLSDLGNFPQNIRLLTDGYTDAVSE